MSPAGLSSRPLKIVDGPQAPGSGSPLSLSLDEISSDLRAREKERKQERKEEI